MSSVITTLGIDPGGTSGLFLGSWEPGERKPSRWRAWQCDMTGTAALLEWILDREVPLSLGLIESFDARERSRKMRGFSASAMAGLIAELTVILDSAGVAHATYPPAAIKDWATDKRLGEAGLIDATSGMPAHARDASRACLFGACKHCGLRDPLSRNRSMA